MGCVCSPTRSPSQNHPMFARRIPMSPGNHPNHAFKWPNGDITPTDCIIAQHCRSTCSRADHASVSY
jgi:hypothetical protein